MKLLLLSAVLFLTIFVSANHQIGFQNPILPDCYSTPLLKLHKELIEIESITGHEQEAIKYLVTYLKAHHFIVELQEVEAATSFQGPRQNVLAFKGKHRKTKTLVTSHIDVVPPYRPYKMEGDMIFGRGAVDAKGPIAAQIIAFEELWAAGKISEGDVALLFVVGEEGPGDGMIKANDLGLSWKTVIFGEPTELKLAIGHKGITGLTITAKGIAGHSGYPERGRSAIAMLVPALNALLKAKFPSNEHFGNTTLNIGKIEGGVADNVIAEHAMASIAIRIAHGAPEVTQQIVVDTVQECGHPLDITFWQGYGPVHTDSDVPGFEKTVLSVGTDVPSLLGHHKRYLYGPGSILVAHSDREHVTVADLEAAVKGYKVLIEHSLKRGNTSCKGLYSVE